MFATIEISCESQKPTRIKVQYKIDELVHNKDSLREFKRSCQKALVEAYRTLGLPAGCNEQNE